jgi:BlaR1 peptidase M56/PDZ domain
VTGRAARLFAEMAGPGNRTRLLVSRQARAPFSCGLLRPAVVLPAGLCDTASDEMLRWVFAHELAHLERRDAWSNLLFSLGQALYFGVPWFWGLRRQARLCQEYLADAAAASAGGRPEDYAQFLLSWTTAPRPPVGACGVRGHSSDLFWRIKTMLQNPVPLERRCPRRWSLAAACGLLSLAVLAAGLTLKATAAPAPEPKEEPKKEAPKVNAPVAAPAVPDSLLPNIEEALKSLPPSLDPEQVKLIRKQMEAGRDQMKKMLELQRRTAVGGPFNPVFPTFQQPQDVRLGAEVEKPSDTLVEQLELPKDQGLIVREVTPDSAAAKAGLKPHDILLEVNDKAVSSDPEEFRKALESIKADTPVDAVVLRKGKKETIKGLSMPEAKAVAPGFPGFNPPAAPIFPPNFVVPNPILPPNFPNINVPNPVLPPIGFNPLNLNGNGVITTMFRTNDHFTTRHQEGSLIITLTGKVEDGKATVNEISVQDGAESNKYESLEKVAEKYRDKVKNLVEMSEKGSVKVEIKAP